MDPDIPPKAGSMLGTMVEVCDVQEKLFSMEVQTFEITGIGVEIKVTRMRNVFCFSCSCPKCGRKFDSFFGISLHVQTHCSNKEGHPGSGVEPSGNDSRTFKGDSKEVNNGKLKCNEAGNINVAGIVRGAGVRNTGTDLIGGKIRSDLGIKDCNGASSERTGSTQDRSGACFTITAGNIKREPDDVADDLTGRNYEFTSNSHNPTESDEINIPIIGTDNIKQEANNEAEIGDRAIGDTPSKQADKPIRLGDGGNIGHRTVLNTANAVNTGDGQTKNGNTNVAAVFSAAINTGKYLDDTATENIHGAESVDYSHDSGKYTICPINATGSSSVINEDSGRVSEKLETPKLETPIAMLTGGALGHGEPPGGSAHPGQHPGQNFLLASGRMFAPSRMSRGKRKTDMLSETPPLADKSPGGLDVDVRQLLRDVCPVCGKVFHSAVALKRHRRHHESERRYECEHCHKMFWSKNHLEAHRTTHTGIKSHKCPTCEKRFAYRSARNRHVKVCKGLKTSDDETNEKRFPCEICDESFVFKSALTSHL